MRNKILFILLLSTANISFAQKVTCDDVLDACGQALTDCGKENMLLLELKMAQNAEIERLRKVEDNASNSKWIWLGLGIIAGGAASIALSK